MEDPNLAEVYVQDFILDSLDVGPVKREPSPASIKIPWNAIEEGDVTPNRLRQINVPANGWHQNDDRRLHNLSPQTDSHNNQSIVVNTNTPPETPPYVYSPICNGYNHRGNFMEEMMWLPNQMREQPLDLRPQISLPNVIDSEWERREYLQQQQQQQQTGQSSMANLPPHLTHLDHHHHMSSINMQHSYSHAHTNRSINNMSVSSTRSSSTTSPRQSSQYNSSGSQNSTNTNSDPNRGIADELLTKLSVRELNKR